MTLDIFREYCLSKPSSAEDMPFGDTVLVFKVAAKMFALASLDTIPLNVNLKCDPTRALELRERHTCIVAGYHQNKKHWNTIIMNGDVSDALVRELVDHSYECVVKGMSRAMRDRMKGLNT